jgi:uncharacterized membrane protein YcgQ (UPF0703/DUF1980 family)
MKRQFTQIISLLLVILLCVGCSATDVHITSTGTGAQAAVMSTPEPSATASASISSDTQVQSSDLQTTDTLTTDTTSTQSNVSYDSLEGYTYDVTADAKNFNYKHVDIVVGEKYYMTQINDWYANFGDYEGKTVEIEGYYVNFNPYTFVGRHGPTCPYCTGGYVDFEFHGLESMLSGLVSEQSWIRVYGIFRQGKDSNGEFYYIEAVKVEVLNQIGADPITN